MATFKRVGFGQVEPNHLSAQRTAQIYAQLPAASDIKVLENGQFVKYDYANGVCNFEGAGEWMMVFNEVKLYDDFWRESYKDFAMLEENYTVGTYTRSYSELVGDELVVKTEEAGVSHYGVGPFEGRMTPRVFKINVGDIWTTNCLAGQGAKNTVSPSIEVEKGDMLKVGANGYLVAGEDANFQLQVVKVYTLADGQAAVKVMRVK